MEILPNYNGQVDNNYSEFLENYQKWVRGYFFIPEKFLNEEKKKKYTKFTRFEIMDI